MHLSKQSDLTSEISLSAVVVRIQLDSIGTCLPFLIKTKGKSNREIYLSDLTNAVIGTGQLPSGLIRIDRNKSTILPGIKR